MGRNGIKLGPRATIFVVVLLAASAVGILTPTLSNTVSKDVQVNGFAVTLTVDGVPDSVAPGDIFRVTAAMANNANRPVPAVLRMEVRNPNTTTPSELTVYAGCGAEEVVSGTRLIYYIGWHGPLLAPKGLSFAAGSTVAAVDAAIGTVEYWPPVLHEIQDRDPAGYVSLVDPGRNASSGVRNSGSALLKVLNYYAMVASKNNESSNLADWTLTTVFADRFIAFGGDAQDGVLVEVHQQTRGSLSFKFWAERPDGLGIPPHTTCPCGPLGPSAAHFYFSSKMEIQPKVDESPGHGRARGLPVLRAPSLLRPGARRAAEHLVLERPRVHFRRVPAGTAEGPGPQLGEYERSRATPQDDRRPPRNRRRPRPDDDRGDGRQFRRQRVRGATGRSRPRRFTDLLAPARRADWPRCSGDPNLPSLRRRMATRPGSLEG